MSAKSLTLPRCPYCGQYVECVVEDDVHAGYVAYTVRCVCYALTTHVTHEALVQGGEDYALDVAHQRWKEVVDRMHMKNPGSEGETGVDSEAVWEAVLDAMLDARLPLMRQLDAESENYDVTFRKFCERALKKRLSEVPESSDPPSEDHHW